LSEDKAKKCPECDGEMKPGNSLAGYGVARLMKYGDIHGDKVIPFYCENCGFIKLYKEIKGKRK
jgi:predicted nucleic-acid-binding Zn-ribbon protein